MNSSFMIVQGFVLRNIKKQGLLPNFDKASENYQEIIKLEALKIIFDRVHKRVLKINPKRIQLEKESIKHIFNIFEQRSVFGENIPVEEENINHEKLSQVLKDANFGEVYSVYMKQVYDIKYKAYSPNLTNIKLSSFPIITDLIKSLSFETLAKILTTPNFISSVITKNKTL